MSERDAHRAERDAEILYWLGKKALEYRHAGSKQDLVRADVIDLMASKISRGAVRPDNTRLPAGVTPDFFQPGHTYTDHEHPQFDWKFRCDTVTTHPEDGERTALGWRHFRGEWEPYAYSEGDWEIHQYVATVARQATGGAA
ncbi:hypothetical protein [Streptomyces sp. NPDC020983]|uniref:hypothetical protein n=1 Tax=Streptomyces sp. NPDC020983 TaxID=3365106 RepID=UPI003796DD58